MNRSNSLLLLFGVLMAAVVWQLGAEPGTASHPARQQVTPTPHGPFHVSGNRIVDANHKPFLMRGTELTPFHLKSAAHDAGNMGSVYGPHSATSLSALRLRFNMNTARLPLDAVESSQAGYFSALGQVVERANRMDLLVVLEATGGSADFWRRAAGYFKNYPNIMFDVGDGALVKAVREAGAQQAVLIREGAGADANLIREAPLAVSATRTDEDRDAQFGEAARAPLAVTGFDLALNDREECGALPQDPLSVADLLRSDLSYFDAHEISWTASRLEPGSLVKDLSFHDATTLENGWACGGPNPPSTGFGRVLEDWLRAVDDRGLFVVSGAGGLTVARGAFALAYGAIMAEHDAQAPRGRTAASLGNVSVQITDARGVMRPAGVLWASEGWGQTNFVIPDESALGPAKMSIVRSDGSSSSTNITIAETAPGFVTGHSCRGPAIGETSETFADGHTVTSRLSYCQGIECRTIAIQMTQGATTRVRIDGSGFRHAKSAGEIEMTIAGVRVPVVSFGPTNDPGKDQVTVEIPQRLRGMGEVDLICHVHGLISNAVQIRIGGQRPVS